MDELARFNKERWEELAQASIQYSMPFLDMDEDSARELVDPEGLIGDANGLDVLCLAGGGGQQSAGFGLLGANVTVLDISDTQLERDREAARSYGLEITTTHGDMRDLSMFGEDAFDVIWHAHSINFVPDTGGVFAQVKHALKRGGIYHLACQNPYIHAIDPADWNGEAYPLVARYEDGEVEYDDPHWTFTNTLGEDKRIRGPREFRHTLETLINGLVKNGFLLLALREYAEFDREAVLEPGSWEHFQSVAPPYLGLWARLLPDALQPRSLQGTANDP